MDNRKKYPFNSTNQHAAQLTSQAIKNGQLQLGQYRSRGRVAKIHVDSAHFEGLKSNPQQTHSGQTAFNLMNWLLDKPRLPGEQHQSFLFSTLNGHKFSGFEFHPQHNIWVDSFRSPHQWRDGEPRSQAQLADALLPSGQWYRHYDTVILASNANDLQVEIVRHWLELTGGSLIIIVDDKEEVSLPIQQLLDELEEIGIDSAPQAAPTEQKSMGMHVTAYQNTSQGIEKTTHTISNLTHYASGLPENTAATVWVYEGVITAPESEILRLHLDTQYHGNDLTFEVDQQAQRSPKHDKFDEIILHEIKAGQKISFKITTTTQGQPPEIRLAWGLPNGQPIQFIPNEVIHHNQSPISDTPSIAASSTTLAAFNPYGFQQSVSLPATSINSLSLTENTLKNSHYFSIIINSSPKNIVLRLDNIELSHRDSWEALATEIESHINQQLAEREQPTVAVHYTNHQLVIECDGMQISQFQLKNQQLYPILVAENPNQLANQFVVGAISGTLPIIDEVASFHLIEVPLFGRVELNQQTGEWQYQPFHHQTFKGHDQFDVIAVMEDGRVSAPMSIQLQAEDAPQLSIPGQRTFSLPDPIYSQPSLRHQPVPDDIQVHRIQLAQTHLLSPNDPYFSLTADRWALLKVDITNPSAVNAPDIVATIFDKQGNQIESIILTGPSRLPTDLDAPPTTPSVDAQNMHRNSYTAPIKGKWIQPDMQIQLKVGGIPITQPYTNPEGIFSPAVMSVTPITTHVTHTNFYREGHGFYSYSPLSWGLEAHTKLPTHQFTLLSYPALTKKTSLFPYIVKDGQGFLDNTTLIHLQYDAPQNIAEPFMSQINCALMHSNYATQRSTLPSEFFYSSIESFPMPGGTYGVIGLATHKFGGGITAPSILWHEVFGHALSQGHTTNADYPYPSESNGKNIAFDQYRQQYTTYYQENQSNEIMPAMYPADYAHYSEQYDAFLAHSDYLTQQAQQFLAKIHDQETDREYQSVYQLVGVLLPLSDGTLHPYSYLSATQTVGHVHVVPQDHSDSIYSLMVTYRTPSGLITESLKVSLRYNEINLNVANKGELVRLDVIKTDNGTETTVFQYKNPESLANRLFIHSDGKSLPEKLQMDNYWRGSKLFWSVSEDNLAVCAKWVENGRLNLQYFSLDPSQPLVDTEATFTPLNHFDLYEENSFASFPQLAVLSDVQLLSDVHINQQIDIGELASSNNTYWATLCLYNEQGEIQEYAPLEPWYLSAQDGILTVKGTIDSTPSLNIAGIKVYIDQHLQDDVEASSIWIQQNHQGTLAENQEFLNYDRPVEFNALISQMAGIKEDAIHTQQNAAQWVEAAQFIPLVA
ncbi:TPA: hypothetical protein ACS7XF_003338 [Providencia alcalifaciens]